MGLGVLTSCYGQLEMVGKILKMLEVICFKSTERQDNEELSGQAGGELLMIQCIKVKRKVTLMAPEETVMRKTVTPASWCEEARCQLRGC